MGYRDRLTTQGWDAGTGSLHKDGMENSLTARCLKWLASLLSALVSVPVLSCFGPHQLAFMRSSFNVFLLQLLFGGCCFSINQLIHKDRALSPLWTMVTDSHTISDLMNKRRTSLLLSAEHRNTFYLFLAFTHSKTCVYLFPQCSVTGLGFLVTKWLGKRIVTIFGIL